MFTVLEFLLICSDLFWAKENEHNKIHTKNKIKFVFMIKSLSFKSPNYKKSITKTINC